MEFSLVLGKFDQNHNIMYIGSVASVIVQLVESAVPCDFHITES